MGSNEVLLVIVEEAHCWAQRGNVNGMDYSRQPVERFITQSNWDIYRLYISPVGVLSLYSAVQIWIYTHTDTVCTHAQRGLTLSAFPGHSIKFDYCRCQLATLPLCGYLLPYCMPHERLASAAVTLPFQYVSVLSISCCSWLFIAQTCGKKRNTLLILLSSRLQTCA